MGKKDESAQKPFFYFWMHQLKPLIAICTHGEKMGPTKKENEIKKKRK